jgi:hypothetical protein
MELFLQAGKAVVYALVLYELVQMLAALRFAMQFDHRIKYNVIKARMEVLPRLKAPVSFERRLEAYVAHYTWRSLLMHKWYSMVSGTSTEHPFHICASASAAFGALLLALGADGQFAASVTAVLTAGAFASVGLRDMLLFSDRVAELEDGWENCLLRIRQLDVQT